MATEKHIEVAKQYFESNPGEGVVHISTDGQVFFQKNYNDAATHQRRIDPAQKLTSIYKKDIEASADTVDNGDGDNANVPNEKWTKEKIVEWLTAQGVETTGKEKKDALLEMVDKAIVDNTDLDENE